MQQQSKARSYPKRKAVQPKRSPKGKGKGPLVQQSSFRKPDIFRDERVITAPVAKGSISKYSKPRILSRSNGDIFICHREYIAEVSGSAAFAAVQYPMNPGMVSTFPWLSGVAQRYDKYRFRKLDFKYETQTATTTVGTVMLVPDYDAADPAPSSKITALSYEDCARGEAWTKFASRMNMENLRALPQYYIRSAALAASLDIKTYDTGNMWLCTASEANNNVIGELWVEYEVELIAPSLALLGAASAGVSGQIINSTSAATSAALFGATTASTGSSLVTISGDVMTFTLPGLYSVQYAQSLTSWTAASELMSYGAGASFDTKYYNSGGYAQSYAAVTGTNTLMFQAVVNVPTAGGTLTLAATVTGGGATTTIVSLLPASLA